MKHSNSRANDRLLQFEALAAFANMGDRPSDWEKFRLKFPDFFPTDSSGWNHVGFRNLSECLYTSAQEVVQDFKAFYEDKTLVPALIWYRDVVRAVWANNDPSGACLYVLYGYEEKARKIGVPLNINIVKPFLIPGQPIDPREQKSVALPQGEPVIDGVIGSIKWKFGCSLQASVYELMQQRWRAKVCTMCGRHFIADKTAQIFCSTGCSEKAKQKRSLEYWNRVGSAKRDKQRKGDRRK